MEINRNRGALGKNTTHPSMVVGFSRETNAVSYL